MNIADLVKKGAWLIAFALLIIFGSRYAGRLAGKAAV